MASHFLKKYHLHFIAGMMQIPMIGTSVPKVKSAKKIYQKKTTELTRKTLSTISSYWKDWSMVTWPWGDLRSVWSWLRGIYAKIPIQCW